MPLQRILEPEIMDTAEEARDYNAMDHSQVNQAFVADFLAGGFDEGDVLDLGTGTALIPIELCRQNESCRVMAVDLSVNMLELARLNLEVARLTERIQLQQVDAKGLGFADEMFDAAVSNSILHHIPEPITCLREAVRVSKQGGRLFFRDLLRPPSQAELDDLVQTYTGQENAHSQQMFADSLHAALSLAEIREIVKRLGFSTNSVQQTTDRHWTWSAYRTI